MVSGISGSERLAAAALSFAQRAAFLASDPRSPTRSARNREIFSLGSRLLRETVTLRSANVSGNLPIRAMATGAKVANIRTS